VAGLLQGDPLLGGNVRYVLSNGGHVAGIVNPPGSKARHEAAGKNRPTAAEWRASAESRSGSWWEGLDQMSREAGRCPDGAASPGSRRHQVLGEAPGDYIHG
jgi:polyhydroxyalkanoate synthase